MVAFVLSLGLHSKCCHLISVTDVEKWFQINICLLGFALKFGFNLNKF